MTTETDLKLQEELCNYNRKLAPLRIFSIIFTIIILMIAYFNKFPWTIEMKEHGESLSLEKQFIFTLQLLYIDILPLLISIFAVINVRISTIAVNPLDTRGNVLVEKRQRILQNTLEQVIVKFILSLGLCTVTHSNELILLPVFTVLFIVGRFTFAIGYPDYRSFGMTMNITSAVVVTMLIGYRLMIEGVFFRHIILK